MTTVAVVLSGCGVFDGSEIHEAVGILQHLSRAGAAYRCFAPDRPQMHVVNHATGQPEAGATRNVLVESARIARGEIAPLSSLKVEAFDAVFFPGGFGAAKNLCSFATEGAACSVEPEVARVITGFHEAGKPIGLCCIAPVLAAKVIPGCAVTIGQDAGVAGAIAAMGSRHVERPVTDAFTDEANRVVTAPAYMYGEAPIHEVIEGIGAMVEATLALVGSGARV
ncbi:MAG: isoprenoid biosynthesis glyoxalase ElbB [Phycisphaerales bacterium]|nr:isoprenoid biosynthesis glyoxalase ElbB [Phycisphaerales bacterium]